jgi:tetratricopeptide (TPR) repeat protein
MEMGEIMKRYLMVLLVLEAAALVNIAEAQHLTSARLYMKLKEYDKAEASAMKAVEKDPDEEEAWFVLGQARYELRKYSEMIDAMNKSLEIKPKYKEDIGRYKLGVWQIMYNAGAKYYNQGRENPAAYDMAIDSLLVAIKAQPDSASSYYVCALAYYGKGDYNAATSMLGRCIEKDPRNTDAIRVKGQIHMQVGRQKADDNDQAGALEEYKQAAAAYEKLYQLDPTNPDNVTSLIDVYERSGMSEKALALTTECIEQDPGNRVCRFAAGVYLLKQNKFQESVEQFKAAIDIDPYEQDDLYKDATYNLGVAYLNWGVAIKDSIDKEIEQASKDKKGKKVPEKTVDDRVYKDKFRAALPFFEQTAAFRSTDPSIYHQLGKIYGNLNMTKEMKEAFDKADKLMKEGN